MWLMADQQETRFVLQKNIIYYLSPFTTNKVIQRLLKVMTPTEYKKYMGSTKVE